MNFFLFSIGMIVGIARLSAPFAAFAARRRALFVSDGIVLFAPAFLFVAAATLWNPQIGIGYGRVISIELTVERAACTIQLLRG